jgi:hypothetical protein
MNCSAPFAVLRVAMMPQECGVQARVSARMYLPQKGLPSHALAEAALASSAAGTDVTKAAFIFGALEELGVNISVGTELVYRVAMHVYAAAGGTRARMGLHVPTADVMQL